MKHAAYFSIVCRWFTFHLQLGFGIYSIYAPWSDRTLILYFFIDSICVFSNGLWHMSLKLMNVAFQRSFLSWSAPLPLSVTFSLAPVSRMRPNVICKVFKPHLSHSSMPDRLQNSECQPVFLRDRDLPALFLVTCLVYGFMDYLSSAQFQFLT